MKRTSIAFALATATLTACTTVSPITQLDGSTYIVRADNSGPFRTQDGMLEEAGDAADTFCTKQHKHARVLYVQGGKDGVLSAGLPTATVAFQCVLSPHP